MTWRIATLLALAAALSSAAPVLTSLEPRGAQRGKSFILTLTGKDLPEGAKILSTLPANFTPLTPPPEKMAVGHKLPFLVELKSGAAMGTYPIRIQTPDAISNILLFTVGAFPELTEQESLPGSREHTNDSIETAEHIEAPVTINGTLVGPDRDYYRVHAQSGDRLVFEVEARRIGSAIDPVLEIVDASGKELARNDDAPGLGVDSRIDVNFSREGDYYAIVHDARFSTQMQNFYRLKIGNFSYADGMFPLGWKRGEKVDVEMFGGNLSAPAKSTAELSGINANLQWTRASIPGEPGSLPFLFAVGDLPEKIEPAHAGTEAVMLDPETVMNGRISKAGEVDRYKLAVSPGEHWVFELRAGGLGTSQLDGVLTINDNKGKKLTSAGDRPPKEDVFSLLSAGRVSSDPWIEWTVPKDTHQIVLTVEDLLQRGGPGFAYRLTARKQQADFILTVNNPYVNIPENGTETVYVSVNRRGFIGPIQLSAPELEKDFIVQGGHIPGEWKDDAYSISRRGVLTITAKPGATPGRLSEVAIWGEGTAPDGATVRRRAQCLGMITEVAGGTGIGDAEGRENLNPFVAPWLGLDLPVMVGKAQPTELKTDAPSVLRLVQGTGYSLKWTFKGRSPDVKPPETVDVDLPIPPAAEIQVRRAKIEEKEPKYAEQGELAILTTTHTPPESFDLEVMGLTKGEDPIPTPAITLQIVQGYSITAPKAPATMQPGAKATIGGSFHREPEFTQPVSIAAEYLPPHVTCDAADLRGPAAEYRLTCTAQASAKPGEYDFQLTPSSVIIGPDKREALYRIAPVTAKLIITETKPTQASR